MESITTGGFNFKKDDVIDIYEMYHIKGISPLDITLYYPDISIIAIQKIISGAIYREWTKDIKK